MFKFGGGGNDNGQQKKLEGGKWQRRENEREYYDNSLFYDLNMELMTLIFICIFITDFFISLS